MMELKSKILVVSDIHLGSLDCERELFLQFLNGIVDGVHGNNLQALIILGDFIDLCTDVTKTLLEREKVQEILNTLIGIKQKVDLILVLGNHEIPVTGDYDEKFKRRKERFLKRFERTKFKELFESKFCCQYLVLKKWKNEDMLLLYDERNQIGADPSNQVKIQGLDLDYDFECLMAHGYQFDSDVYRFFVGQIWKSLITNNSFEVKETYDYFWNYIIKNGRKVKPITYKIMKNDLAKLKNKSLEFINTQFTELSNLEFNLIKANMRVMKRWHQASKPDYYFDEIKAFLEDEDYDFSKINHLIYGHSHNSGIAYGTINNQRVEIMNDGAWQRVQPSYIEILSKGTLKLRSFSNP